MAVALLGTLAAVVMPATAHAEGGMGMFTTTSFERRTYESLAAGCAHTVVAQPNGTAWSWGRNDHGQLGSATTGGISTTPRQVYAATGLALTDVIAVAAGCDYSLALRVDGTVWAWGANADGQLGDGTTIERNVAVPVTKVGGTPLTGIRSIAAGDVWSGAIGDDGRVWTWGDNATNQLGRGTGPTDELQAAPVKVSGGGADLTDAMALALGPSYPGPGRETIVVTAHGTLQHFGAESTWPTAYTNTPMTTYGVKGLSVGGSYTAGGTRYAVLANGTVNVWGNNTLGMLGDGSTTDRAVGANTIMSAVSGVIAVAAGDTFSVALTGNGELWGVGSHASGATGRRVITGNISTPARVYKNNTTTADDPRTMVAAGSDFAVSLGADNGLRAWGTNASGQFGNGATSAPTTAAATATAATAYAPDVAFTSLEGTYGSLAALRSDGTVWTAGGNTFPSLGWEAGIGLLGTGSSAVNATDRFFRITSPPAFNTGAIARLGVSQTRDHFTLTATDTGGTWFGWGWGSHKSDIFDRRLGTAVATADDHMNAPRSLATGVFQGSSAALQSSYLTASGVPYSAGNFMCKGTGTQIWLTRPGNYEDNASFTAAGASPSMTSWLSGLQAGYGRSGRGQPMSCGMNEVAIGNVGLPVASGFANDYYLRQPAVPGSSCPLAATNIVTQCRDSTVWSTAGALQVHGGGDDNMFALSADGSVRGWGSNYNFFGSRLGNGATGGATATPTTVKTPDTSDISGVIALSGNDGVGIGIRSNGQLYTWGQNSGAPSVGARCGVIGASDYASLTPGAVVSDAVGATIVGDSGLNILSASGRISVCGRMDVPTARGSCGASVSSNTPVGVGCRPPAPTTPSLNASVFNIGDNVRFTFQAQDPDAGDYLKPWVQVVPTSSSLSATECGDYAATWYTGTQVATPTANTNVGMQVDVTTLPLGTYKWQACVRDTFGNASSYLAGSGTFSVGDVFPPAPTPATGSGVAQSSTAIRWTINPPTDQGSGIVLPVGMHADAYSFDGGTSWQTSDSLDQAGLSPDTWYGPLSIRTRDANGNVTALGSMVAVRTPPAPPGSRVTTLPTATGVTFGWAASTGADQYRLRVYSNGTCATPIGTDPMHVIAAPTTTFAKTTGLSVDRSYWYTLEARSSTTSQWSEASACTALSGTPGRTSITVTGLPGTVTLGSMLPGGSNMDDVTLDVTTNQSPGYELFVATDGLLRNGGLNIPMIATGTLPTPATWAAGSGLGLTVLSGPGLEAASRWGNGTLWAPLPGAATSMYDSGALAVGSDLTTQVAVRMRVVVPAAQAPSSYSMQATFTAVGKL